MIRRWLIDERGYRDVWLLLITVLVIVAVATFASAAEESHQGLCDLRADVKRRVANGEEFVRKYPQGAFGFSRAQIDRGIRDQRRTVRALQTLDC